MKKGQELEVFIEKYEFGGVGVAYEGDKKVYVKGGVPGQKLNVRLTKKKKDYADGKLLEVVEKAPYEIDAPCPHFGVCGGCISQNVPYENQLKLKTGAVLDLFAKAGVSTGEFLGIEESPEIYEYRNKMEFSFGDLSKGGELQLGMHKKGSPFSVVTVDKCMLIDEDFRTILNYTLSYFREKNLPHYRIMQHEGYLRHFIIRKAKNADEIMVNLVTTSQIDENLTPWLEGLKSLNLKGKLVSVMHTVNDSLSDAVVPDKVNILDGETFVTENILGLKFKISPFSFFQTNTKGTEKLYSIVRDFIGEEKKHIIFDLYCGTGTIGQVVSPYGEEIKGVEIIEEAVEAANENAKLNGLTNCNFIAGDVAKVIADLKGRPDLIILDPPRSGVHPKALEYVVKFNAKEIIYVSCNPKTLVTDLAYLEMHGYKVDKTKLMDMFPMTPHVETVVGLRRKDTL